jgi:hypothetical protein
VAQEVECLPSKFKALTSNSSTEGKKVPLNNMEHMKFSKDQKNLRKKVSKWLCEEAKRVTWQAPRTLGRTWAFKGIRNRWRGAADPT